MLPLTEDDERLLLRLARWAIEGCVQGRPQPRPHNDSRALKVPCGAFVTLRRGGDLRGCIGHVETGRPLGETIVECAVAAALEDPRFPPVVAEELGGLRIEISVLSPLIEILPADIEIGRHGLLVSQGIRRGVLLPQVAVDWKWDRRRFLQETCRKAGLPSDAWRHGARLRGFTTQVFEEPASVTRQASADAS